MSDLDKKQQRIGILNMYMSANQGAIMTCYVLQDVLLGMGYHVHAIPYMYPYWARLYKGSAQERFERKFIKTYSCENYKSSDDLKKLNQHFDTFIVGSDQVWRWWDGRRGFLYYGNFIDSEKKKIACSASFGVVDFDAPVLDTKIAAYYAQRFDAVSVREQKGVAICKESFNIEATFLLDPVFWKQRDFYVQLTASATVPEGKYILKYVLDKSSAVDAFVQAEAKRRNCGIVTISKDAEVLDWLAAIINADFVVTDSFHGLCFSIIGERDFICCGNVQRGQDRFSSILDVVNLQARLVDLQQCNDLSILSESIDYSPIVEILKEKTEFAKTWLQQALDTPAQQKRPDAGPALDAYRKQLEEASACLATCYKTKNILRYHRDRIKTKIKRFFRIKYL